MYCKLCLEESIEPFIDIQSDESIQCNLIPILAKYFEFCFDDAVVSGMICRKCWIKVEAFHNYYIHIETIHKRRQINVQEFMIIDYDDYGTTNKEQTETDESPPNRKTYKDKSFAEIDVFDDSNRSRKKHVKKNDQEPETIFQCATCNIKFLSRTRLYRHIKNEHISLQFKCPEAKCVESYGNQLDLDEHIKTNHTRVPCPQCDKLISQHYLMYHLKEIHDEQKRVVCDLCGNISNNARKHETHFRMAHTVPEKFQCDICKAYLSSRDAIRAHMRRRHVEPPVDCPICGRPCANKNSLYKHKKTHTAEYRDRFKCNVCDKGFRDKTNLKQHLVVHNGDSDCFSCSICRRTFRCSRSLNAHQKRMHPVEDPLNF